MAPKYPFGTRSDGSSFSPKAPGDVRIAGTEPSLLQRLRGIGLQKGLSILGGALGALGIPGEMEEAREEGLDPNRRLVEAIAGQGLGTLMGAVNSAFVAEPADPLISPTIVGLTSYDQGDKTGRELARSFLNTVLGEETPEKEVMYGTLPPSARVVTDYPEGIPTGVGGGNMGSYRPESVAPTVSEEPVREQGSAAALPGQSTTLSTPKAEGVDMQSELLKDAMTMRRAKEMAELGIYGGDQATTKGSKMYQWVHNHGDLADDLIRDKRMKEVRIARMFGRDLPTDAAGMDGQMGNFEAFEGMREMA